MIFKKAIHTLLILIILTLSKEAISSHIDIGYKDGFALETTFSINDYTYMHTERYGNMYSYGAGVGYKNNYLTATLIVNRVIADGDVNNGTTAKLLYNDRVFSYFGSIGYTGKLGMGWKFGAGYNLSEKLSLVTHYSNSGLFIGIRRWL